MKILQEFREFAVRGNVLDLAVGVIIGAAFGKIVSSLVEDIIMPPIGLLMKGVNFTELYFSLDGVRYATLAEAKKYAAPVIAYGQFINVAINFIVVAFCVFLIVKGANRLRRQQPELPPAPAEKDCPYCLSKVPLKATRCAQCTSHLEPAAAGGGA
ncbi:mechanosensitive ion channel protein MscL [Paenibacillus darwinianus]|uniref:Large-conductance mechanosensitive channel n=1 Tax=Paenibacillus darwinianus TaxID=1380763 RepID=A0A9W5S056_9BACL|nr:large-conductance mechanosensitive channel protein MscL [Paenibacillus darwinianus]EXX85876.1 mechanosensitive ion channel protein MscL [Paenibacillus darwinianus]EXX86118.1 mechanosensitive ion channel protein MscL [Paenibacillus darwinianus]EXX86219.1 mechanosensitive ion channel protein MscL [Paenibacillus darwinianus]